VALIVGVVSGITVGLVAPISWMPLFFAGVVAGACVVAVGTGTVTAYGLGVFQSMKAESLACETSLVPAIESSPLVKN
jgi:hypothetical protein